MSREPTAPPAAPLGREYADLFLALSAAFQRSQMYPGGHPTLDKAVATLLARLGPILADRPAAVFAVGGTQLFVGGAATDPEHLLLRELAGRLFRRNVGTVRIGRGVEPSELVTFLQGIVSERADALRLALPHVEVEPLNFDSLVLDAGEAPPLDEAGEERTRLLWTGVARAMLGEAEGTGPDHSGSGEEMATAFDRLEEDAGRDAEVIGALRAAAEAFRNRHSAEAIHLRRQVTQLLRGLRPRTIERLLARAGGAALGHAFLLDLVHLSSAPVALDILRSATRVDRRTLSPALLQLFSKLAAHAEAGPPVSRRAADEHFEEAVRALVEGWDRPAEADEEELDYEETLDHLPAPLVPDLDPQTAYRSDPWRILTMSLDMADLGDGARRAARAMIARGRIRPLVRLLDELPEDDPLRPGYHPMVATPDALVAALRARPPELDLVERLAPEVGTPAIPLLLDALAAAEERGTRRRLLDLLARFGNAVAPYAITRYAGAPWYVQRNLLRLLQLLPEPPAEAAIGGFAEHPDARVRVEGLRLLLRHPAARARGVAQALADPDPACLRVGVMAAVEACPPAAAPLLIRHLAGALLDRDLRPLAIRALAGVDAPEVPEVLLRLAARRYPLLGWRVAPRSKDGLAALAGLARHWRWQPRVGRLLARAERHRDPEVRQAVAGPSVLEQLGLDRAAERP